MMIENYQGERLMELGYPIFRKVMEITGIDEMNSLGWKRSKSAMQPVIFGSDAHFSTMIADYSNIMPLVEKAEFPDDLVLNYQPEKFLAYLKPTPEK